MAETAYPSDCNRCQALCCVYPAFDKSDMFGLDKAGGEPCPNLGGEFACSIHAGLGERGFRGCQIYDCLGAGPRVIAFAEFAGRSWRDDPATAEAMFSAFQRLKEVHELAQLLGSAGRLPLSPAQQRHLAALRDRLGLDRAWTAEALEAFEGPDFGRDVRAFLAGLRDVARPAR